MFRRHEEGRVGSDDDEKKAQTMPDASFARVSFFIFILRVFFINLPMISILLRFYLRFEGSRRD